MLCVNNTIGESSEIRNPFKETNWIDLLIFKGYLLNGANTVWPLRRNLFYSFTRYWIENVQFTLNEKWIIMDKVIHNLNKLTEKS